MRRFFLKRVHLPRPRLPSPPSGTVGGLNFYTRFPRLRISFDKQYHFAVQCRVRPEPEESSIWRYEVKSQLGPGMARAEDNDVGIFRSPTTGELLKVPGARCARFWIEFELGKFLFPEVLDKLDLLLPAVVDAATEIFDTSFAQGCRWES